MKSYISSILATSIGFSTGILCLFTIGLILNINPYVLKHKDWLCTAQEVTKDAFPIEYECTQYSKRVRLGED